MPGTREGRPTLTLVCAEQAELLVRLPPGSVLFLPGECGFEIRSGRVEAAPAPLRAVADAEAPKRAQPRDLRVVKALRAMEAEPRRRWTLAALAKAATSSRSAFARAFASDMSETPGCWLARRRLELAREILETSDVKLAEIAERVGYASEFALSRAFKRHFGIAPARLRRARTSLREAQMRCAA